MRSIVPVSLLCLVSFGLSTYALGQRVKLRLHVPPSGQLQVENLWWVTIDNTTRDTFTGFLRGEVHEARQGLVFKARTDSFPIPPGSKRLTLRDVHIRDQWAKSGYQAFITRSGVLPDGDYSYKVWLEPKLDSAEATLTVSNPPPPRLVAPADGAVLLDPRPSFSWTRPASFMGTVTYRLLVVEVLAGQAKEEAVRSNRPWFEQTNIIGTLLQFPLSARALERDKRYAWQVEAVLGERRGMRVPSEVREFTLAKFTPSPVPVFPLTLTRQVVRQGNAYAVALNLRNNTDQEMTNVVVVDSNFGFQVLDQAAVYIKTEGGFQPSLMPGTFETGTDDCGLTSWIKVTKPNLTIPAGKTLFVGYSMMPLHHIQLMGPAFVAGIGCRVTYSIGNDQYAWSYNNKSIEVTDCSDAWRTADYLIVTNPVKLYQLNSGARSSVNKLLATIARLAYAKKGAILHFPASSANQLRSAIKLAGAKLAPGWQNSGYLLLVGEGEVVPCWDTVRRVPTRPLPWSDHPYADIDDDDYPELRVGRIIGATAANLTIPIRNSLAVHAGEDGAHYDGGKVLIVTGVEKPSDNFTPSAGPGAQYLNTKGLSAGYWGMEFITTPANVLGKALTHIPVENGGAPADTFSYMLNKYTEAQLAAWLFAVYSSVSFNLQYPVQSGDSYFQDPLNRTRRLPKNFGASGIAQAVQLAENIENGRRGQWVNQQYSYPASPVDSTVLVLKSELPKYDGLFFSAHGSYDLFSRLTATVADASDYTLNKRRPVVVSFACWNGDYPCTGSLARALLKRGMAAVIAYTAMTNTGWFGSQVGNSVFLQYWARNRKVGDVFWDWKNKLAQTALADTGNMRMLFGHNLYGEPKYGGN